MNTPSLALIGTGTMGAALTLNIAERGYDVALYSRSLDRVDRLIEGAGGLAPRLRRADTVADLVASMPAPRALILMVPAGGPVDQTIADLIPLLSPGDMIIDAGNSDFQDTRRRAQGVEAAGLQFLGVGVSGGEEGARHGPSIMVGGTASAWQQMQPVLEAIAAKFQGAPCVAHLGTDGAGHFVKTVHNGIEYADMQMIAEIYGLLRDGAGQTPTQIAPLFHRWNAGDLQSYLIEITGKILDMQDQETGKPIVDVIVDQAGQKGTGRWTIIEAIKMGQAATTIEAAVGARVMSAQRPIRQIASQTFADEGKVMIGLDENDLEAALRVGRILGYAQGFQLLRAASTEYNWNLDFTKTAEIWRAGCIIRSALLDQIATAFQQDLPGGHLILADAMAKTLQANIGGLRRVVSAAALAGIPIPCLSAALSWYDGIRQARGTADMIQAQRDFFGAHSFGRVDQDGLFHGPWGRG